MIFPRKTLVAGALAGCLGTLSLSQSANGEIANTSAEMRAWSGAHGAFAGPTIDPGWFQGRQTIVYLLPKGADLSPVRKAASQIMQQEWVAGRHDIKHVFISNVSGRARFAARQRIAVHEIAEQVTIQAGQDAEFAPENMPFVREQVFFVWDPQADLWNELVGPEAASDPKLAILLLDQSGKVMETIDPTALDPEPELGQLPQFVNEVHAVFAAGE